MSITENNISDYITYQEAVKSQTAVRLNIVNKPSVSELACMRSVAHHCFDPLCERFEIKIGISSFYRSAQLNKAIGGAKKNSQHIKGQAIDIDADMFGGITNSEIFNWLKENVQFDQLIWEFGNKLNPAWVHISFVNHLTNRNQIILL